MAKHWLLNITKLQVKGKHCLVLDPNKTQVPMKVHWVYFRLSKYSIRTALELFNDVLNVSRDTWYIPGLEGVETATRLVRLTLNDGVTLDQLPHQLH